MISVVGKVFIGIGLAFDVLGCLGLVRLPDVYNRLQAAQNVSRWAPAAFFLEPFSGSDSPTAASNRSCVSYSSCSQHR